MELLVPVAVVIVAIVGIGFVFATLYRRAEKDRAYVRTGLGGQKVVLDGGAVVLPIFQAIAPVNLRTLRLDVARSQADALITKDRMRVDIGVEFYVRVKPDAPSIALAAQTLGDRTNNTDQLRELVEAKFVDGLRSVAATMSLADLQEKRADFVRAVQTAVASDLELNGLELEAASLTKLDQTDTQFFNPNNAFDAEGLASLTRIVEAKKRERNEVVRATEVAIAQQDLEARKQTLTIDQQKREAELSQERDIANKMAETRAAAAAQREAEAKRAEEEARIDSDRAIAERRAEAQRVQETANITAQLAIREQQIAAEKQGETLAIAKQRDIELANQERAIAVADRSKAESEARAAAEDARAKAIAASEGVDTAKEVAIAERERQIAVIEARRDAEQKATEITVAAEAEREAAANRAAAVTIAAKADADAAITRAEAQAKTFEVEAEGQRKLNEARNMLAPAIVEMEITKERLRIVPLALAEAMKPLEKIGDVKIIDLGGALGRGGASGGGVGGAGGASDNLLQMLLAYRAQAPMVDALLKESGFTGADPVAAMMGAVAPKAADGGDDDDVEPGPQGTK